MLVPRSYRLQEQDAETSCRLLQARVVLKRRLLAVPVWAGLREQAQKGLRTPLPQANALLRHGPFCVQLFAMENSSRLHGFPLAWEVNSTDIKVRMLEACRFSSLCPLHCPEAVAVSSTPWKVEGL